MSPDESFEIRRRLRRLRTPLLSIFWGGLFVVLDFNLGFRMVRGGGAQVDILNDTLGFFLVAIGVVAVASFKVWDGVYEAIISLVAGAAVAAFLGSVAEWWFPWRSVVPSIVGSILWCVGVAAIILFSVALAWLADTLRLAKVALAWRRTAWLSLACYGGAIVVGAIWPFFLLHSSVEATWLLTLFVYTPAMTAPLVSLFLATGQMVKAAGASGSSSQVVGGTV